MALSKEQIEQFYKQAQEAQKKLSSGAGSDIKKIQDGENRYRILPSWKTKDAMTFEAYRMYARHWVKAESVDENTGKSKETIQAVTLCDRSTYGKKCAVCDAYFEHYFDESLPQDVKEKLKGSSATSRVLVNALHRNGVEPDKVIVLELPYTVFTEIFGDPKTGNNGHVQNYLNMKGAVLFDLDEGIDLVIRRKGAGWNTKYSVDLPRDGSTQIDHSVLDDLEDLDAIVESFKHTAEDEAKAISAMAQLVGSSASSPALDMSKFSAPEPKQEVAPEPKPAAKVNESAGPSDMADVEDILAGIEDDIPF